MLRPAVVHAHSGIVKVGRWGRVEGKRPPGTYEDHQQADPPHPLGRQGNQKQGKVAEADLRERVFKGEVRLLTAERPQPDAEHRQEHGPPGGMHHRPADGVAPRAAMVERKKHAHSNEKTKRRLNQVVQRAAAPGHMALVMGEKPHHRAVADRLAHAAEVQHLRHHQEHHKAAIRIDRRQPLPRGRLLGRDRRFRRRGVGCGRLCRRRRGGWYRPRSRFAGSIFQEPLIRKRVAAVLGVHQGPPRGSFMNAACTTASRSRRDAITASKRPRDSLA